MNTSYLISLGGKSWEKNGMHRIYFNNWSELIDGWSSMSNNQKRKFVFVKFWYDVNAKKFSYSSINDVDAEINKMIKKLSLGATETENLNSEGATESKKSCWECGLTYTRSEVSARGGDWNDDPYGKGECYCGC